MESIESYIRTQLEISARLKETLARTQTDAIASAAEILVDALVSGHKILLCGNGGSAADSQHIAAELVGRFQQDRQALPAIALTTDTSILTAVANDYGYEHVFERQVLALGQSGDVLVGISTSGQSRNVLLAMIQAKDLGLKTIALMGEKGGLKEKSDVAIQIPSSDPARIQEGHIAIGHIWCDLIEKQVTRQMTDS
jgi:D-sedoheptulose 7-phosphate isomerase